MIDLNSIKKEALNCALCSDTLPFGPNPVFSMAKASKILIIGQAPGIAVHQSGIPWDDPSGKNLRNWLGCSTEEFYDANLFGILPMGFCYPGTGKSGDLAPRKECAPKWHPLFLEHCTEVDLILLIGKYAQDYYLPDTKKLSLTERVKNFEEYLPKYFVLPHPSPRNNIWMKKNAWFKSEVLPVLKSITDKTLKK